MPVADRQGREGSRWYNARPSAEEVIEWFKTVKLHDGLDHANYIAGVTLIPGKEKSEEVTGFRDGLPQFRERQDLVFTPYIKVETRVAYFHAYMAQHPDWYAEWEDVWPVGGDQLGLPPGFFKYTAKDPKDKVVTFVGCSKRLRIYERSRTDSQPIPILLPSAGTKVVATSTRWDADVNAMHKAETGAVGRALGFAGMLVVPGSGVATAEDMLELNTPAGAGTLEPALPAIPDEPAPETPVAEAEQLRARVRELVGQLNEAKLAAFQEWASQREFDVVSATPVVLRGAIKKIEKLVDA